MMSLFDDEQMMRTYTKDIEKETEKKSAERMIKDGELLLKRLHVMFLHYQWRD